MDNLEKITIQEKEIEIEGNKFKLKPLGLKHMKTFMDLIGKDPDKRVEATDKIIRLIVKENIKDITEEQLDNLTIQFVDQMIENILDINGFKLDEKTAKIIEEIKQKQSGTEQT